MHEPEDANNSASPESNNVEVTTPSTTSPERTKTDDASPDAPVKREKTAAQRAAAARKRARRMARMRPAEEVSEALMERFPLAFFKDSRARQPLAVGIHVQLAEAVGNEFHKLELQRFLNNYAHSLGYLHSLADKKPRVNLQGEATDEVITDEMASEARKQIDEIQTKRAARGDAPRRGPAKPGRPGGGARSKTGDKPGRRGVGYLGTGRRPSASKPKSGKPTPGSAEELRESAIQQRNRRSATIIEKKRRVVSPSGNTLLGQKLADAGLGQNDAPRKKLRLGRKSDGNESSGEND